MFTTSCDGFFDGFDEVNDENDGKNDDLINFFN
jgi:hypothetical protein